MTLLKQIKSDIAAQGPMRLDTYMATCLFHPTLGYYTGQEPFGAAGDFITAPEISQMFGELIGLCLAQSWMTQGSPAKFTLAELGPGRGTLMQDILRATKAMPDFQNAAEIVMVEASPRLRRLQAETLSAYQVTWVDDVSALPAHPLFLIANEFFDALPIRQFVRSENQWRERQIGLNGDALEFGLGPALPQPALEGRTKDTSEGDLVEICDAAINIIAQIGARIEASGGAALIIDYGDWRSLGDTLQAVQDHAPIDPLATPGQADLTAHVDFEALAQAAAPSAFTRVTPQGVFLERLGITERAQKLAAALNGVPLDTHIAAHRRLTHPLEMGNLFKVMALYQTGGAPPPGLDP